MTLYFNGAQIIILFLMEQMAKLLPIQQHQIYIFLLTELLWNSQELHPGVFILIQKEKYIKLVGIIKNINKMTCLFKIFIIFASVLKYTERFNKCLLEVQNFAYCAKHKPNKDPNRVDTVWVSLFRDYRNGETYKFYFIQQMGFEREVSIENLRVLSGRDYKPAADVKRKVTAGCTQSQAVAQRNKRQDVRGGCYPSKVDSKPKGHSDNFRHMTGAGSIQQGLLACV